MKRLLILFLSLLLLATASFAESADGSHILTGSGTQILDGFEIIAGSRMIVNCDEDIKVTMYQAGYEDQPQTIASRNSENSYTCFLYPSTLASLMVETQGSWTIEILPFSLVSSPDVARRGSYISDVFQVQPPVIVNITFDKLGSMGSWCSVLLHKMDTNGNDAIEEVYNKYVSDRVSFDMIIKPEKNIMAYSWVIDCAHDIEWSIKAK